jgi:hypothetical protein
MMGRYGSPEKQGRVEGFMGSSAMQQSLSYNDNDVSYGLVNTKPQNKAVCSPKDLKKETWKPKNSLNWYNSPGERLTLQ